MFNSQIQQLQTIDRQTIHKASQKALQHIAKLSNDNVADDTISQVVDSYTSFVDKTMQRTQGLSNWKAQLNSEVSKLSGSTLIGVSRDVNTLSSAKKVAFLIAASAVTSPTVAAAISQSNGQSQALQVAERSSLSEGLSTASNFYSFANSNSQIIQEATKETLAATQKSLEGRSELWAIDANALLRDKSIDNPTILLNLLSASVPS